MELTEKDLLILETVGSLQEWIQSFSTEVFENYYSFDFNGIVIVNPMIDESGRFTVNPVEHYGEAFLESDFITLID